MPDYSLSTGSQIRVSPGGMGVADANYWLVCVLIQVLVY